MRLLNASTLLVEDFTSRPRPKYAILSHRWTDDEVTFHDVGTPAAPAKTVGYAKIKSCCSVALAEGLSHVWIDTCCIDKSSSAELSEAINSMFRWYGDAEVCFAYLQDVLRGQWNYTRSEWFDRGWTLQELIAPRRMLFFSRDWKPLGSRRDLLGGIIVKTGVEALSLGDTRFLKRVSIAAKMSWAAKRKTFRDEDMAYCLLGVFDVALPPLYGEGSKSAFARLQRKILEESSDLSWLVWDSDDSTDNPSGSVLAPSPSVFVNAGRIYEPRSGSYAPTGLSITNYGIHIRLPCVVHHNQLYIELPSLKANWTDRIFIPVMEHMGRLHRVPDQKVWITAERADILPSKEMPVVLYAGTHQTVGINTVMPRCYVLRNETSLAVSGIWPEHAARVENPHSSLITISATPGGQNLDMPRRLIRLSVPEKPQNTKLMYDYVLEIQPTHSVASWILSRRRGPRRVPGLQRLTDWLGIILPLTNTALPPWVLWLSRLGLGPPPDQVAPGLQRLSCRLGIIPRDSSLRTASVTEAIDWNPSKTLPRDFALSAPVVHVRRRRLTPVTYEFAVTVTTSTREATNMPDLRYYAPIAVALLLLAVITTAASSQAVLRLAKVD